MLKELKKRFYPYFRIRGTIILFFVLSLILFFNTIPLHTYSYFLSTVSSQDNTFKAIDILDVLQFNPGSNKCCVSNKDNLINNYQTSQENRIYQEQDINFDFGEIDGGKTLEIIDILRLINISENPLSISLAFEGQIATLIHDIEKDIVLLSNEKRQNESTVSTLDIYNSVYSLASSQTSDSFLPQTAQIINNNRLIATSIENIKENLFLLDNHDLNQSAGAQVYEAINNSVYENKLTIKEDAADLIINSKAKKYNNPYRLKVSFKVSHSLQSGFYTGYLVIKVNGNFLTKKIPAKIFVNKQDAVFLKVYGQEPNINNKKTSVEVFSIETDKKRLTWEGETSDKTIQDKTQLEGPQDDFSNNSTEINQQENSLEDSENNTIKQETETLSVDSQEENSELNDGENDKSPNKNVGNTNVNNNQPSVEESSLNTSVSKDNSEPTVVTTEEKANSTATTSESR